MTVSSVIQGNFPHSWEADVLTRPPLIAPPRHFTYPRQVPGEEDALARGALQLLVRPRLGGTFLATCALGFQSPSVPSGLWSAPLPDQLCAVAGGYAYLVDTVDPAQITQIPLRPVTAVLPVEKRGLLLFAGFHHVAAWSVTGLLWQSARLSWEGLTMGTVEGDYLHGTGWDLNTDRELPFTVDLRTGEHQGGGFLR